MLHAMLLSLCYAYICMCILLMLQLLSYVICHSLCIYMFLNVCFVAVFYVPQVSTNQAAQPQGNTVSLDINYDNPVAQNDPLLIPSFTNETDVFISQTLKEKVWNFEYVDLALFLRQNLKVM